MASLREHIDAEFVEIANALAMLPVDRPCTALSPLELAGAAAILQSFYNGIENVLRQVLLARGGLPEPSPTSHRDLLTTAGQSGIIGQEVVEQLGPFLQFRHFFRHSYTLDLDASKVGPMVQSAGQLFPAFRAAIERCIASA